MLESLVVVAALAASGGAGEPPTPHPILFVTQMPIAADFATIGSTFANHRADMASVGRGGDLYIRYPDGSLRNLTAEAGYGSTGTFQGADAIAVRDPAVHWSGTRALFSMVVGGPAQQYQVIDVRWQVYEVTGLELGATAAITKVPNQPESYNNVSPIYSPDGRIVFTSDRPRNGAAHLYPQQDEYESTPTNTGLWSLDPASGALQLLEHAPSGSFTPLVDSFGRILFTRWDHLQRDQQADADSLSGDVYGTFNLADESADAAVLEHRDEVFPEPRPVRTDLLEPYEQGHRINHFFPWQIFPDGTEEETLNHVGRHELHDYFDRSFNDDPNLDEFIAAVSGRANPNPVLNFFQIDEDPGTPGRYVAVDAPEFGTHASGQIVGVDAPPTRNPDQMVIAYWTHPATGTVVDDGDTAPPEHSGHYRDPLVLSDGRMVAAHTAETRAAANEGTRALPDPRYDFQLRFLAAGGHGYLDADVALTGGIVSTLSYYDPDVLVQYSGALWELSPVEVRPRPMPPLLTATLPGPEAQVFSEEGVDPSAFRADLERRGLALTVSRDVTTRDAADRQQPFNLRVAGGGAQTTGAPGRVYDVAHVQFFQGDQVRGIGGADDPRPGRRVLAQVLHEGLAANPPNDGGPPGSVALATDGSMAALLPTGRALAWQLTDPTGLPVVRERYWITFQPGEIRVCASCHGANTVDQAGNPPPDQPPEALRTLLRFWKAGFFSDGFESGDTGAWAVTVP